MYSANIDNWGTGKFRKSNWFSNFFLKEYLINYNVKEAPKKTNRWWFVSESHPSKLMELRLKRECFGETGKIRNLYQLIDKLQGISGCKLDMLHPHINKYDFLFFIV